MANKKKSKRGTRHQIIFKGGRWQFVFSEKDKGKICQVIFCRRPKAKFRKNGKVYRRSCCPGCRYRIHHFAYPHRSILNEIRKKAHQRGITCSLSYRQFCKLVAGTRYITARGTSAGSLHLDRKDGTQGYHWWNLRIITATKNIGKGNRERRGIPEPEDDGDPY